MMLTLDRPPIPMRVPVLTPYRPVHGSRLGQLVQVSPDVRVEAPISIELGSLPLSIGAFAGAGLAFLVRGSLKPGWGQTAATLVGAGLGIFGIINLVLPKTAPATQPGVTPVSYTPPTAPAGGVASETPQAFIPSAEEAFAQVNGKITFPSNYTEVDIWPTDRSYPVEIQLQNGSAAPVTFSAILRSREEPGPFGDMKESSLPVQVTLGPHEIQNIPVQMPIAAWEALTDYVVVDLDLYKQRVAGTDMVRLDSNTFTIE